MVIEVNLANLIFIIIGVIGAIWALLKLVFAQIQKRMDERHVAQEASRKSDATLLFARLDTIEASNREEASQWQRMERELLQLKADLPLHYVRREDYIRGQSVIEAKLDGLAGKMENIQLRSLLKGSNHVD